MRNLALSICQTSHEKAGALNALIAVLIMVKCIDSGRGWTYGGILVDAGSVMSRGTGRRGPAVCCVDRRLQWYTSDWAGLA